VRSADPTLGVLSSIGSLPGFDRIVPSALLSINGSPPPDLYVIVRDALNINRLGSFAVRTARMVGLPDPVHDGGDLVHDALASAMRRLETVQDSYAHLCMVIRHRAPLVAARPSSPLQWQPSAFSAVVRLRRPAEQRRRCCRLGGVRAAPACAPQNVVAIDHHVWVVYDLTRIGERDFEALCRALAVRVLGDNVQVFGDGPDGVGS